MRKLAQVEEAKALMSEAMDWSVFQWLWEKGRVRGSADRANAALDDLNKRTKARWRDDLKTAYKDLQRRAALGPQERPAPSGPDPPPAIAPETMAFLEEVKRADQKAHRARMDAEKTFDQAERFLSTSLAIEGCKKAIRSWELGEAAIRLAETGVASKTAT
jgi:hypothetical protein